jgi:3-deoxy-D-manno-octulosonate 8-phosphate phosphatase (KDO 8-P phosphatase)
MLDSELARRLRLVALDVDGVLTDGGIYVGEAGGEVVEFKRFHTQDGLAMKLLREDGLRVVLVTARPSKATELRARELGIDELVETGGPDKVPAFSDMLKRLGLDFSDCAFAGDDLTDAALLERVALPIAVANAVPEVKARAQLVTDTPGGHGAVREIAEALLRARGSWEDLLRPFVGTAS